MISNEFVKTLSKLTPITDKAVLKYPITTINSDAKDVIVNIDASKLGCSQFDDTGVYELSKFVNMFNLLENPEIKREEDCLVFKVPGNIAVFTLSDINMMSDYNLSDAYISNLVNFPNISEFKVSADTIKKFKAASSIFSELNVVTVSGKGSNNYLKLDAHNRFNHSNNTYEVEYLNTNIGNKDYLLKLNVENFNRLPVVDYTIKVKYNEKNDSYRVLFENELYTIMISRIAEQ